MKYTHAFLLIFISTVNAISDNSLIVTTFLDKPYCDNKSEYEAFFSVFEKDFAPNGIDIYDSTDQVKISQYIQLRDRLLNSSELSYILAGFMISRGLLTIYREHISFSKYQTDIEMFKKTFNSNFYSIFIDRNKIFTILDRAIKERNPQWVSLHEFEPNVSVNEISNGWEKYIKQANLFYTPYVSEEFKILSTDTVINQFSKLFCLKYSVESQTYGDAIQVAAYIADFSYTLFLCHKFLEQEQYVFKHEKFFLYVKEKYKNPANAGLSFSGHNGQIFALLYTLMRRKNISMSWGCAESIYKCK